MGAKTSAVLLWRPRARSSHMRTCMLACAAPRDGGRSLRPEADACTLAYASCIGHSPHLGKGRTRQQVIDYLPRTCRIRFRPAWSMGHQAGDKLLGAFHPPLTLAGLGGSAGRRASCRQWRRPAGPPAHVCACVVPDAWAQQQRDRGPSTLHLVHVSARKIIAATGGLTMRTRLVRM